MSSYTDWKADQAAYWRKYWPAFAVAWTLLIILGIWCLAAMS